MNLYEYAVRNKLRFKNPNGGGVLNAEHLLSLSLTSLDTIAVRLRKEIQETQEESFIRKATGDSNLTMAFELVKAIILEKQEEAKVRSDEHRKAQKRQKILNIIATKKDDELASKSVEELEALLK